MVLGHHTLILFFITYINILPPLTPCSHCSQVHDAERSFLLPGHKSLMLAENARSLVFFCDSIWRHSRANYNDFFGSGQYFLRRPSSSSTMPAKSTSTTRSPWPPLLRSTIHQAVSDLNHALDFFS
ncbi:hypothetical protein PCANC_07828 [Puccinia coronata f. sp. avenae]|uniref:Secreted protein n=1 Tax=Puccinia coronata f. sp. avenae TaxID=200324 RepID=A0A2N5VBX2_9BASI|nr:hypothetical protein PCANC_17795 [Puccinia coronata f. sp. avenae]PLW46128.1 hypothetical protein PCASD_04180 [Puccinia coronata f. sp. avenae]PLW47498.1 hypothetical protein PCANC_07828 [Puccinia coronata f. sp. avenae]